MLRVRKAEVSDYEQIMKIGSQPFIYMRTDAFSEVNKESERLLLELIHCRGGRTVIYTGSGTGAMAAVVENYVTTKQKAFVIDGGSFGHRWYQMCQYYGIAAVDYRVPFACDIDYDDLESQIARERPDVFLCQHHETSTGQLYDLACISRICHKYGVSMVVDVISTWEKIVSLLCESEDCYVIMDEIGNGIIPLDRFERNYREQAGIFGCYLARRADEVIRVICGIGNRIK